MVTNTRPSKIIRLHPDEIRVNLLVLYKAPEAWVTAKVMGLPDSANRVPIFSEGISVVGVGKGKGRYFLVRVSALRKA